MSLSLNTITWKDLPGMIEACFPLWRDELARIQLTPTADRTKEDMHLSVKLAQVMMQTYTICRMLEAEARLEARKIPPKSMREAIAAFLPADYVSDKVLDGK
jgi:hypothetical protein